MLPFYLLLSQVVKMLVLGEGAVGFILASVYCPLIFFRGKRFQAPSRDGCQSFVATQPLVMGVVGILSAIQVPFPYGLGGGCSGYMLL